MSKLTPRQKELIKSLKTRIASYIRCDLVYGRMTRYQNISLFTKDGFVIGKPIQERTLIALKSKELIKLKESEILSSHVTRKIFVLNN